MQDSATRFWNWFKEHNKGYSFLNQVDPEIKEKLLNDLLRELHEYCDKLYFEIGSHPDDECQELIITAEGNKDYFSKVEYLVGAAPQIDNWIFIAFIPPRDINFQMDYEGLVLNPEEMWFMPLENKDDPSAIGISICLRNYELVKDHDFFESAIYKILDVLLGEKSAASDIEYITFDQLPDDPEDEGMSELAELPDYIAWKKNNC
jgi:hypothetical protein